MSIAAVTVRAAHPRRAARAAEPSPLLPHWSEVATPPPSPDPPRPRATPTVASVLRDLVSWAADIAVKLTHDCPEDRAAIEEVRRYAYAWLAGDPCPAIRIEDVLTTSATLLSAIDLGLDRSTPHPDDAERHAIGAALTA